MNANWFKAKTAGLPRWAWIALAGGGIGLGLYLRHKHSAEEVPSTESEEFPTEGEAPTEGVLAEGGLAGAGLVGGAGSASTPVNTPYVPEGFISAFENLSNQLVSTNQYILEHPTERTTEITREAGGGGPPEGGNHETQPTVTGGTQKGPNTSACSPTDVNTLTNNKKEIERLQGQIKELQANINAHPKANQVQQWRGSLQSKQNKVQQLSAQSQAIRNKPGCGKVQV